jgi:uncharacterized membrane protein
MADWLEHSVQVEVDTPIAVVWNLWSDLEKMPNWMPWIQSVKISQENPSLSRWTLTTGGWEFSWMSRMVKVIPNQIIQWESVDGLPNRGAIRFYGRNTASIVKLTVAYRIPGFIGELMDSLFLGRLVESTLQANLHRFRDYAVQTHQHSTKMMDDQEPGATSDTI